MKDFKNVKFCQSCMMPMQNDEEWGTEKDGVKSADYCKYCYENGEFKEDTTMEKMVEFCIPYAIKGGAFKTEAEARKDMLVSYKTLKRWAANN
ncbi:MAG: zinc ribbon domain-containing protein [Oscillospiraceae bacterium]|nr:zinc ribbon domain-containing protein [Oscillospiraceae bacterium]